MFFKSERIRERMNAAGKKKSPFLFAIDFEMEGGFFLVNPFSQTNVWFEIEGRANMPATLSTRSDTLTNYRFDAFPESYDTYRQRFDVIMNGLKRGDSYLANLTIRTPLACSLTMEDIFRRSKARYKLCIPGKWVCFSPECFVKIANDAIFTFPMKGTIDARIPDAGKKILHDPKETAEHNTIVDLLRNDIGKTALSVKVNRFRYIDTLHTNKGPILQVSSEIEGKLATDHHENLGDLLFELLPAGSVSGAPKKATLKIIHKAEQYPRGFYCGVAGYYDGSTLESFVLIRFIEQQGNELFFRSGGGITAMSDCREEYEEAIHKIYLPL